MRSLRFHCHAQTASKTTTHGHVRSCLTGFSEKRPQRAWFSPPVVAHQNNSTRCSLRTRQIYRQFFEYVAAVLQFGGHLHLLGVSRKVSRWSYVDLREFGAQQKSCGRELFMTACDCCFFAKRENNLLQHHRPAIPHIRLPRFKEYMSLQCQGNHEHVWKQTHERKRESIQLQ